MTTAEIDAIILTLENALGTGTASVSYEGRTVTYKSTDEILKALSYFRGLKAAAVAAAGGAPRRRQIRLSSSKGLD